MTVDPVYALLPLYVMAIGELCGDAMLVDESWVDPVVSELLTVIGALYASEPMMVAPSSVACRP